MVLLYPIISDLKGREKGEETLYLVCLENGCDYVRNTHTWIPWTVFILEN